MLLNEEWKVDEGREQPTRRQGGQDHLLGEIPLSEHTERLAASSTFPFRLWAASRIQGGMQYCLFRQRPEILEHQYCKHPQALLRECYSSESPWKPGWVWMNLQWQENNPFRYFSSKQLATCLSGASEQVRCQDQKTEGLPCFSQREEIAGPAWAFAPAHMGSSHDHHHLPEWHSSQLGIRGVTGGWMKKEKLSLPGLASPAAWSCPILTRLHWALETENWVHTQAKSWCTLTAWCLTKYQELFLRGQWGTERLQRFTSYCLLKILGYTTWNRGHQWHAHWSS